MFSGLLRESTLELLFSKNDEKDDEKHPSPLAGEGWTNYMLIAFQKIFFCQSGFIDSKIEKWTNRNFIRFKKGDVRLVEKTVNPYYVIYWPKTMPHIRMCKNNSNRTAQVQSPDLFSKIGSFICRATVVQIQKYQNTAAVFFFLSMSNKFCQFFLQLV